MADGSGILQVQTTVGDPADADRLAEVLVDAGLAACVQVVGPIRSRYRWQGAIETAEEWLLLVKTTRAAWPRVEQALRGAHPYDEPELMALAVEAGSAGYLGWVAAEVTSAEPDGAPAEPGGASPRGGAPG